MVFTWAFELGAMQFGPSRKTLLPFWDGYPVMHDNVAQVIINFGNTRQGRLTIHGIVVPGHNTKELLVVAHQMRVLVAIIC